MTDPTFDARRWTATIDTSPPAISDVAAVPDAISPDGDGRQERAALEATGGPDTVTWSMRVLTARGAVVRTMSGRGRTVATTWDGKDERGRRVADGSYRVEVRGTDALGNDALAARQVVVDTADPRGDLVADVPGLVAGASAGVFSPDGDGWQDAIDLRPAASEAVSVSVVVRDRSGRRRWSGSAPMASRPTVRWRGRDKAGATLPDGRYHVVATVTDAAGNRSTLSGAIRIDRTASALRADPPRFYPQDGDRLARTSELTFRLRGRATTALRVRDASGGVMRTAWKDRVKPAGRLAWTWDGRDGRGAVVAPGSYQVELVATAGGVTQILRRSVLLDAFAIAPATTTPTAGSRLRLDIRATERLRSAPRVTIRQPGVADRTMTTKRLADGRYRVDVRLAAGIHGPARLIVRAKDAGGRTDSTTLVVAVR
jgi:flagellar hook assembly protein FlgD